MLITKINDDYILGVDFLKLFNLQNIFTIFLNLFVENNANFDYCIEHVVMVPSSLMSLFEKNSEKNLKEKALPIF